MMSSDKSDQSAFSAKGFDWDNYLKHRPFYPPSLYNRIYDHHRAHSGEWKIVHDVGAGPGIASQEVVHHFEKVIVSDPNDEYLDVATRRLIPVSDSTQSKFIFLREKAETSSVKDSTVDLIVCFEAIMWTDMALSMKDFARQLKKRGTLAVVLYGYPLIINNSLAQTIWDKIWLSLMESMVLYGGVPARALMNGVPSLDSLAFLEEDWEAGAKRILINPMEEPYPLGFQVPNGHPFPSQIGERDRKQTIARDEDWFDRKDVPGLKGVFECFTPSTPEAKSIILKKVENHWQELEEAIGDKKTAEIAWPVVLLLATRR